jgi:hypothetical protein
MKSPKLCPPVDAPSLQFIKDFRRHRKPQIYVPFAEVHGAIFNDGVIGHQANLRQRRHQMPAKAAFQHLHRILAFSLRRKRSGQDRPHRGGACAPATNSGQSPPLCSGAERLPPACWRAAAHHSTKLAPAHVADRTISLSPNTLAPAASRWFARNTRRKGNSHPDDLAPGGTPHPDASALRLTYPRAALPVPCPALSALSAPIPAALAPFQPLGPSPLPASLR